MEENNERASYQDRTNQIVQMAEPINALIKHAKECDALGKTPSGKARLLNALMTLGRSRKEAERALAVARVRARKSARKAERHLENLLRDQRLWAWTEPEEAIRKMRACHFGGHENAPLTDIELALVQAGNALWIMAVYPALVMPIFSRLEWGASLKDTETNRGNAAALENAIA